MNPLIDSILNNTAETDTTKPGEDDELFKSEEIDRLLRILIMIVTDRVEKKHCSSWFLNKETGL